MTATVLSGRELAAAIRGDVASRAAVLADEGRPPVLAVVVATEDAATSQYVSSIVKSAEKTGIVCRVVDLGGTAPEARIRATLRALSDDVEVTGIILQTPLPAGLSLSSLASDIGPAKDVDGASPTSLGRLVAGLDAFAPATAEAVMRLLESSEVELCGKQVTVIGRSVVVGKPLAHLLLARHATVTVAHSRTGNLPEVARRADVLIVAVGRAGVVTRDHVRPGAVVIDVGTNVDDHGALVGDVDPAVSEAAGALSPVPGGVGPVTTAILLEHVVEAAENAIR